MGARATSSEEGEAMLGGLEGFIFFIPFIYLVLFILAWLYTRKRFP